MNLFSWIHDYFACYHKIEWGPELFEATGIRKSYLYQRGICIHCGIVRQRRVGPGSLLNKAKTPQPMESRDY